MEVHGGKVHLLLREVNDMLLKHPDFLVMLVAEIGVDALLLPQVQD